MDAEMINSLFQHLVKASEFGLTLFACYKLAQWYLRSNAQLLETYKNDVKTYRDEAQKTRDEIALIRTELTKCHDEKRELSIRVTVLESKIK